MIDGCYDIKPTATNKKLWVIVEVYLDAVDRKDAGGGQRSCLWGRFVSRLAFSSPSEAFLLTTSLFVSKFKSPKAVSPYTQHQNNIHNIIAKLETSPSEKDCRR